MQYISSGFAPLQNDFASGIMPQCHLACLPSIFAHLPLSKRKISMTGSNGCDTYVDFHDVPTRKDIDTVMISTPDHWHTPIALAALAAGKDVSLEKPITRSIAEGRKLSDAAVAELNRSDLPPCKGGSQR